MSSPSTTLPVDPPAVTGPDLVLAQWFARGLERSPDGPALRVGGVSTTYRELHAEALALAGAVVARTPQPRRIGLLAARSVRAYAGLLAAQYCGAAVVPLNPEFPAERTAAMITAAGLDALIVDGSGARGVPALAAALADVPVVDRPDGTPLDAPRPAGPDDVAYILFTSGSTGRPKGVPVRQRNVDAYLRFVHDRYGFTSADVFSQTFDLTFDLAMFDMFTAWGCGGTLVAVPSRAFGDLAAFLNEHAVTVWFSAPSAIALVRSVGGLAPGSLPTLRWSLFCGEPLLAPDAAGWQQAAPRSTVENLYGPTELTISCSVHRWLPTTSPARCVNDVVPIGRMHPGMRHRLEPVEGWPADVGELCVTGPQRFDGYLDAGDDRGRFLDADGERWYRTGDVVRDAADGTGELLYLGRRDHQVQIRGVRVELAEVEWALRRVDGIDDAVAVVAGTELVAFYLGDDRPAAEFAAALNLIVPRALVPRRFRRLDAFPLNANRKIDRTTLARRAADGT